MKNNKVKVLWKDAVIYKHYSKGELRPSKMITVGILEKENENYIIIRFPRTSKISGGQSASLERAVAGRVNLQEQPTFLYVPKIMVESINYLNRDD